MRGISMGLIGLVALLAACAAPTPSTTRPAGGNGGFIGASNWNAWVNRQPPGPAKLIVTGDVEVSSTNRTPELRFESLSRSLPPILNLRLVITGGEGIGGQAITTKQARYESADQTNVGSVTIAYPDGTIHTIREVKQAQ